jgi:hypothetical protein
MVKYYIKIDAPDYLIGHGPDDEFIVIARTLSLSRAFQITHLLNKDIAGAVLEQAKAFTKEMKARGWKREDFINGLQGS